MQRWAIPRPVSRPNRFSENSGKNYGNFDQSPKIRRIEHILSASDVTSQEKTYTKICSIMMQLSVEICDNAHNRRARKGRQRHPINHRKGGKFAECFRLFQKRTRISEALLSRLTHPSEIWPAIVSPRITILPQIHAQRVFPVICFPKWDLKKSARSSDFTRLVNVNLRWLRFPR